MRCLRPIHIYNQSRFVVPTNRDQLLLTCNCGKCANCQRNKFSEWSFRAFKHYEDCVNHGGYMLFDTLTYDDAHLPHLKDFDEFKELSFLQNHSCFRRSDIKLLMARLRRRLVRHGYGSSCFDYFLTSEYGDDKVYVDSSGRRRRGTLRPHYHVLFFVRKNIPPLLFSSFVAKAWKNGRTDGVGFKPSQYVLGNVFSSVSPVGIRKVNYVSKYVMKHSGYVRIVYNRVMSLLRSRAGVDLDWLDSDECKELRRKMLRVVGMFHNQSKHFGLSALNDISVDELFKCGFFKMPNGKPTMFNRVPISNYYLRKLCYDKVVLADGYECWTVKPDKKYLLALRRDSIRRNLFSDLLSTRLTHHVDVSSDLISSLVDYQLDYKGRFIADGLDLLEIGDRFERSKLFVYASVADKNHFGMRFVSNRYLGYKDNYLSADGAICFPLRDFVEQTTFNENSVPFFLGYDGKLGLFSDAMLSVSDDKQYQFEHLQSLRDRLSALYDL